MEKKDLKGGEGRKEGEEIRGKRSEGSKVMKEGERIKARRGNLSNTQTLSPSLSLSIPLKISFLYLSGFDLLYLCIQAKQSIHVHKENHKHTHTQENTHNKIKHTQHTSNTHIHKYKHIHKEK